MVVSWVLGFGLCCGVHCVQLSLWGCDVVARAGGRVCYPSMVILLLWVEGRGTRVSLDQVRARSRVYPIILRSSRVGIPRQTIYPYPWPGLANRLDSHSRQAGRRLISRLRLQS
eukprot:scaffold33598_cov64-Cyclotella_meneghiniana.AAC.3